MIRKVISLILVLSMHCLLFGQLIEKPNFALASHPMKVKSIQSTAMQTTIELSIENQIETGSFCADKNIYIKDIQSNQKHSLIKSEGIPVCPESYQFTQKGEVLNFKLFFPKINSKTKYLTIIEDCDQNCFSIKGVILKEDMNKEINLGYDYYAKGKSELALAAFKMFVKNNTDYPFCYTYLNIIQILVEKGDLNSAKTWYNKIVKSNYLDKYQVLARLKEQNYYAKLIQ